MISLINVAVRKEKPYETRGTVAITGLIWLSLVPAHAATVVDFTINEESGFDISGNLAFTLGSETSGQYPITAVTGTISGASFTEAATGATCYEGSCLGGGSVLTNTSGTYPVVNGFGVALTLANGDDILIQVGASSPYYAVDEYSGADSAIYEQPFALAETVSSTPLPAALPLFAGGLGIVGFLAGRKKRKAKEQLAVA
jgi:hypothetical protein